LHPFAEDELLQRAEAFNHRSNVVHSATVYSDAQIWTAGRENMGNDLGLSTEDREDKGSRSARTDVLLRWTVTRTV
jgi:hypothetical protein